MEVTHCNCEGLWCLSLYFRDMVLKKKTLESMDLAEFYI